MIDRRLAALLFLCCCLAVTATGQELFPAAPPESVGLSSRSLDNLAAHVRAWVDDADAVGAEILLIKSGKTVLHVACGLKDLDDRTPLEPNTIACIRSMSKPLTGTAIQMLIDEGKLALDDPASKYLPSFANDRSRAITVAQLLTHTSGLPLTAMSKPHTTYADQRAVADEAGRLGPATPPGEQFQYSDAGTEALAAIVGVVSGMPPDRFLRERLFEPLQMGDTYCVLGRDAPDRSRLSSNHAGIPGAWHEYWNAHDAPLFPYFLAAASVYSTARDYARFLKLWMDEGRWQGRALLSRTAVQRALQPQRPMLQLTSRAPMPTDFRGYRIDYGQLWMVYSPTGPAPAPRIFGHGGSDGTRAWAMPEHDLMALYFTQSRNGLSSIRFESLLDKLVRGEDIEPPRSHDRARAQLPAMIGSYHAEGKSEHPDVFLLGPRLALGLEKSGILALSWPDEGGAWRVTGSSASVSFAAGDDDRATFLLQQRSGATRWIHDEVEEDLPDLDALLALRHVHLGGDAVARLHGIRLEGTIDIGGVTGPLEMLADDRGRYRLEWHAGEAFEQVACDGARAWAASHAEPVHELRGVLLAEAKRDHPLAMLADWRTQDAQVEIARGAELRGERAVAVRVTPPGQPPAIRYVSLASGALLEETRYVTVRGNRPVFVETEYGDPREVAGVRLPFRRTAQWHLGGGARIIEQYERCETNVEIPQSQFRLTSP